MGQAMGRDCRRLANELHTLLVGVTVRGRAGQGAGMQSDGLVGAHWG